MKATKIEERTYNTRQTLFFSGLYKLGEFKIKVSIKVDSYDFQSHCKLSVFDKNEREWNFLYSIPYTDSKSVKEVFAYRNADELRFNEKSAIRTDKLALIDMAKTLLS